MNKGSVDIEYFKDDFDEIKDIILSLEDFEILVEQGLLHNDHFFREIANNILEVKIKYDNLSKIVN